MLSMATAHLALYDTLADWEIGFLSATARDFFQAKLDYLTPDGAGVSSEGGMRVASDGVFAQRFDASGSWLIWTM